MSSLDFDKLNVATKYPSIATYHDLDSSNGMLMESGNPFTGYDGTVYVTEKIDGANARLIIVEDDWFIGSRETLLTSKGDRVYPSEFGIVDAVRPFVGDALQLVHSYFDAHVFYLEVYGNQQLPAWKSYGNGTVTGVRCFDYAQVPLSILERTREAISSWRQHGGQTYASAQELADLAMSEDFPFSMVPLLRYPPADQLPESVQGMQDYMTAVLPTTEVALGPWSAPPEGLVLRTEDRSIIRKARFENYRRTLQPPPPRKPKKDGV